MVTHEVLEELRVLAQACLALEADEFRIESLRAGLFYSEVAVALYRHGDKRLGRRMASLALVAFGDGGLFGNEDERELTD